MTRVTVSAQGDYQVPVAWIDWKGMRLVNSKGARDLAAGEHFLTWAVLGKPGQKVAWTITDPAGVVLGTGGGKIADKESSASGHIDFEV